jgi:hypothetical protein
VLVWFESYYQYRFFAKGGRIMVLALDANGEKDSTNR